MIIYDKTGLHNVKVFNVASRFHQKGLISDEELSAIKDAYPSPFYTPNLFVRIGFFILTCIISSFGCGLLSLLFGESGIISTYGWFVFLALINYVALEVLVNQNKYYKAGIDDALIWISGGLLVGSCVAMVDDYLRDSPIAISAFVFIVSAIFTLRYTYLPAAIVTYMALFVLLFFSWQEAGDTGILTMPFLLMAFSGLICWACKKLESQQAGYYYSECLIAVRVVALITLYLSGNYYVVKELGDMLNGTVSETIPLAWFFWLWSIALPFVYIALGVRTSSLLLIRTGLLLIAAAVFTFRNYYHVLPIELALTIAGIAMAGLAWFLIRFLKTPKAGFTSEQLGIKKNDDELNVESLVVAETFSDGPDAPDTNIFGGGQFGGGGSSSGF
jgi:hypothetical protein